MNVSKTNGVKLFALVAVLAMVFAGFAVMTSGSEISAANTWNMDGDINAEQDIQAGTDAVASGNFNVTNNATLTIKDGASFVINEGVTVTVNSGSSFIVEPGAAVEINGKLVIKDKAYMNNGAVYDGTNAISGHYVGVIVNGTLNAEKNAVIDGAAATGITMPSTGDGVTTATGFSALNGIDGATDSNINVDAVKTGDNTFIVKMTGNTAVAEYLNGEGTPGYWVALRIGGDLATGATVGDKVSITIDGRSTSDQVWVANTADIWLNAGTVYNVTVKFADYNYNITVDTTGIATDNKVDGKTIGSIVVNDGGVFDLASSGKNNSSISNQEIIVAVGGTADINALVDNVTVKALPSNTKNPYTYGKVEVNDGQTSTNAVDLQFTATSERIASAFIGEGDDNKTTRAVNYILNVDGDVNAGNKLRIAATEAINGQRGELYYADADDECSNVKMTGIVSVSGTLDVAGYKAVLAVANGSNFNITGTVNIDGDKDGAMNLYIQGTVNVTGNLNISEAADAAGEDIMVIFAPTNTAYLNVSGSVQIDGYDVTTLSSKFGGIYGVAYETKDSLFITGLQTAITDATTAEQDTIHVLGYAGIATVLDNPYVVSANIEIPVDMTVCVDGVMLVAEGVELTINAEAEIETDSEGLIIVEGVVMDNSAYDFVYGTEATENVAIQAEVRSTDADQTYYRYTSFKNALANTQSGTIELFGAVYVDGNMTIPAGITVDLSGETMTINTDSTLIVDGVIDTNDGSIVISNDVKEGTVVKEKAGILTVNNMIVNPEIVNDANPAQPVTVAGFKANGTIGDYEDAEFLLSPATAAANAATLYDITSQGKISYSGDLTFTAGEDNQGEVITIAGDEISIGKIIVNGFSVDITATFTGAVEASVTAGASSVSFNKAAGYTVAVSEDDSGDAPVTALTLAAGADPSGKVTISAGTVELTGTAVFGASEDKILTVAQGATLVIPENANLQVATMDTTAKSAPYSAIVVEGTLTIEENGQFTYAAGATAAQIQIDGIMNIGDTVTFQFDVYVDGTIAVAENATAVVSGVMYVNGTVSGAVDFAESGTPVIIAYNGASIDTANLDIGADNTSGASAVAVYINGEIYLTAYAPEGADVIDTIAEGEYDIVGYEDVVFGSTVSTKKDTVWYTDDALTQKLEENALVEDTSAVYAKLAPNTADIQVSVGTGMSLYIDGIKVDGNTLLPSQTTVGTHTVEVTVNPGYKGDATITFAGQAVTNGTFTVTPEMAAENADPVVLSVTGNISVDTGSSGSSDGMGLTEILLIILVILIVVMAIMVALRLMRS